MVQTTSRELYRDFLQGAFMINGTKSKTGIPLYFTYGGIAKYYGANSYGYIAKFDFENFPCGFVDYSLPVASDSGMTKNTYSGNGFDNTWLFDTTSPGVVPATMTPLREMMCFDYTCPDPYYGNYCNKSLCETNGTEQVCSAHGTCVGINNCKCDEGYLKTSNITCNSWMCGSYEQGTNSDKICTGGRGTCIKPGKCNCTKGYSGNLCELYSCMGISTNDLEVKDTVCSSRGTCTHPDICKCDLLTDSTASHYKLFGQDCDIKFGTHFIRATMHTLVAYFEVSRADASRFYQIPTYFESFDCEQVIKIEADENPHIPSQFKLRNCSMVNTYEETTFVSSSQLLVIHLDHLDEESLAWLLDDVETVSLKISPFRDNLELRVFPNTHSMENIFYESERKNKFTHRTFSESEDSKSVESNVRKKPPSGGFGKCKEKLMLHDECIELYECVENTNPDNIEKFSYWSIGFIPSTAHEEFFYTKFYFPSKEDCEVGTSLKSFKTFGLVTCSGSLGMNDNFMMYEKCSNDASSLFGILFNSQVLLVFFTTTAPLDISILLIFVCVCICSFNCVLFNCRKLMSKLGIRWFDAKKKNEDLEEDEEDASKEDPEEEEEDESEGLLDESIIEKSDDFGEDEALEVSTETSVVLGPVETPKEESSDSSSPESDEKSEEEEGDNENEKTFTKEEQEQDLDQKKHEDSFYIKSRTLEETPQHELFEEEEEEEENNSVVEEKEYHNSIIEAKNVFEEIQTRLSKLKDSMKGDHTELKKSVNQLEENNKNCLSRVDELFESKTQDLALIKTKKKDIATAVSMCKCAFCCYCHAFCCCFTPCFHEILKCVLMLASILTKEGFAIWFSCSEFLDDRDIDPNNKNYITLSAILNFNQYLIWVTIFIYLSGIFLFIVIYVERFFSSPLMFCVGYGSLKEYVYYRVYKSTFLVWFMCINLCSYIIKFSYLDKFERDKMLGSANWYFSIIFPEVLLLFNFLDVLGYNGVSSHSHNSRLKKLNLADRFRFPKVKIGLTKVSRDCDVILEDFFQILFLIDKKKYSSSSDFEEEEEVVDERSIVVQLSNSDEYGHLSWEYLDGLTMKEIMYLKDFFFPQKFEEESYWTVFHHHRISSKKWLFAFLLFPFLCMCRITSL